MDTPAHFFVARCCNASSNSSRSMFPLVRQTMTSLSEQNRRNLPPPFRERRSETVGLRLMRVVLKTDSRVLAVRPDCYRADRLGVYALD
jgi:hypothetical protein